MSDAFTIAQQALSCAAKGDEAQANRLFEQGLAAFPESARFANSAGNFHFKAGRFEKARTLFQRALKIDPNFLEAAVNLAVTSNRLGDFETALEQLIAFDSHPDCNAMYWRIRSETERSCKLYRNASQSLDLAFRHDPASPLVARSRAGLSLERSEPRVLTDFENAIALNPGDPHLICDYARALRLQGRIDEAITYTDDLTRQFPRWQEPLLLQAELRWAKGEGASFDDHIAEAARSSMAGEETYLAWFEALFGVDRPEAAAEALAQGRARWPGSKALALAQAMAFTEAGKTAEADAVLAAFPTCTDTDWCLARGRNWLRAGDLPTAEKHLAQALSLNAQDVSAWALIDLCWRAKGDPRHEWLHRQEGLVQEIRLPFDGEQFGRITALLDDVHTHTSMPLGQSVKSGSQTPGPLLARTEEEIADLEQALYSILESYRETLPPYDPSHPLLRRRGDPWRIIGSWSIRLNGEGHHAQHIHPHGVLSSASYYTVPGEIDEPGHPGWLELGRPPEGLAVGLEPLQTIRPRPGYCILFPSTMFHGTRPIASGTRMTVAFDVAVSRFSWSGSAAK
jgi:tetratricopeptide (TPR) repeat protein